MNEKMKSSKGHLSTLRSKRTTEFWEFNQNNSGGTFHYDLKNGITHFVLIEAKSKQEAIDRALAIGIYFDGCSDGRDCSCCGDRWHPPYEAKGTRIPEIYGKPFKQWRKVSSGAWMKKGREVCVHYLNGKKAWA